MPSQNLEWYNLNCTRPYPLDDQATLLDASGNRLAHHLIADLNLVIPRAAGRFVHVGGISLGKTVAAITLVASEDQFGTTDLVPVAAVTVSNPEKYVHYALDALYPGVGGWIVWGTGVDENELMSYRFTSGRQSLLLPRAARFYNELPIATLGKLYGTALTGLVALSGGTDIEIVKECRALDGYWPERDSLQCDDSGLARDVIVIRLKESQDEGTLTLPASIASAYANESNLFAKFSGPCGGRPESNTCGNPEPIETLNAVSPDCCGLITIRFTGCAKLTNVEQEVVLDDVGDVVLVDNVCGVVVDCSLDLSEACPADTIPTIDGTRRWEVGTLCVSESISTFTAPVIDDTPGADTEPASSVPIDLPFTEDFYNPIDSLWETHQGFWGSKAYTPDDVGGWDTGATMYGYFTGEVKESRQCWGTHAENCFAVRNTLIWHGDVGSFWRKCYANFIPVVDNSSSNYPRFGIVFNHRETSLGSGIYEWWALELARSKYYIVHYDGTAEHIVYESTSHVIEQNKDVLMGLSISPHFYDEVAGEYTGATLYAYWSAQSQGAGATRNIGPIWLENFMPDTGNFGVTSKNCHVAVNNFEVHYASTPGPP